MPTFLGDKVKVNNCSVYRKKDMDEWWVNIHMPVRARAKYKTWDMRHYMELHPPR